MDVQKQVDYWRMSGEEDIAAARSLLDKGHLRHAMFFAHLAIEKVLKAHVTRRTSAVPPRTHSLVRLVEISVLSVTSEQDAFLRRFGMYQLEGRYPDSEQVPLNQDAAIRDLSQAQEMLTWLVERL
ncbi:MAG: HEPN domain-containing protein [Phycisphaerae bacterium]|nr:HEPN domain-containing protein [Phycisphaerae bacterium]